MGKINKFANIYDNNGNKLRSVTQDNHKNNRLTNITVEELRKMLDEYTGDKNSREYMNMQVMMFTLANQQLKKYAKESPKRTKEQVVEELTKLKESLGETNNTKVQVSDVIEDVDFEEVKEE